MKFIKLYFQNKIFVKATTIKKASFWNLNCDILQSRFCIFKSRINPISAHMTFWCPWPSKHNLPLQMNPIHHNQINADIPKKSFVGKTNSNSPKKQFDFNTSIRVPSSAYLCICRPIYLRSIHHSILSTVKWCFNHVKLMRHTSLYQKLVYGVHRFLPVSHPYRIPRVNHSDIIFTKANLRYKKWGKLVLNSKC